MRRRRRGTRTPCARPRDRRRRPAFRDCAAACSAPTILTRHARRRRALQLLAGLSRRRLLLGLRPAQRIGSIPTNDGAPASSSRFRCGTPGQCACGPNAHRHYRLNRGGSSPEPVAAAVGVRSRSEPIRGIWRTHGFIKASAGPGWALVGDAGYFKDPLTAHGITDALRDAELLARAVVAGSAGAFGEYEAIRLELSHRLFEITDAIASFEWTDQRTAGRCIARSAPKCPREVRFLASLEPHPWLSPLASAPSSSLTLTRNTCAKFAEISGDSQSAALRRGVCRGHEVRPAGGAGRADHRAAARAGRDGYAGPGHGVPESELEVHGAGLHRRHDHRRSGGGVGSSVQAGHRAAA